MRTSGGGFGHGPPRKNKCAALAHDSSAKVRSAVAKRQLGIALTLGSAKVQVLAQALMAFSSARIRGGQAARIRLVCDCEIFFIPPSIYPEPPATKIARYQAGKTSGSISTTTDRSRSRIELAPAAEAPF